MDFLHTPAGLFTSKNVFNVNSCQSLLPEGWSIRRTPADMTNLKLLSAIRSRNCSKSTQLNLRCISPCLNSILLNADRPWKIGSLNGSEGANGPRRVVLDKSGQKQLSRREHAVLSTLIASVVASTAARHMVAGAAGGCRALAVDSTNPTGECLRLQMWEVVGRIQFVAKPVAMRSQGKLLHRQVTSDNHNSGCHSSSRDCRRAPHTFNP